MDNLKNNLDCFVVLWYNKCAFKYDTVHETFYTLKLGKKSAVFSS